MTLFSAVSGFFLPEDLLVNEPLHRIKVLGNISDSPDVLTRSFLSPAHSRAARQISEWMADAGEWSRVGCLCVSCAMWPAASIWFRECLGFLWVLYVFALVSSLLAPLIGG